MIYTYKTPYYLQEALKKEIESITSDMEFKRPKSEGLVPLAVYLQALPVPKRADAPPGQEAYQGTIDYSDDEPEESVTNCPWCKVMFDGGNVSAPEGDQSCDVVIAFGIYDNDLNNQGHQYLLNLIDRIYTRFAKNPILDHQYTCSGEFDWALQDEDTYPYYFGALVTSFTFKGIRRENDLT